MVTLWALVRLAWPAGGTGAPGVGELVLVLAVCLATNVYITGINQVVDVGIDAINKPWLPLPAGALSPRTGLGLALGAGVVGVGGGFALSLPLGATTTTGVVVGTLYSVPPARLKRFPVPAGTSILFVRGLVLTLGVAWHLGGGWGPAPGEVIALAASATAFGAVVAVLKDVPDRRGDVAFGIRTFATSGDPRRVQRAAMALLVGTYLAVAASAPLLEGVQPVVLAAGELGCAALALAAWRRTDPNDPASVAASYRQVWRTFYAHHAAFVVAAATAAALR